MSESLNSPCELLLSAVTGTAAVSIYEWPDTRHVSVAINGAPFGFDIAELSSTFVVHPGYWEFTGDQADQIAGAARNGDLAAVVVLVASAVAEDHPFVPEEGR